MFVAAQPSSRGDFPSTRDSLFWDTAVEADLAKKPRIPTEPEQVRVYYEGPFVTELVPKRATRAEAEDLGQWTYSDWVPGFLDEARLVDPLLLVAMGVAVFEALRLLTDLDVPIERVTHHGYFARPATRESAHEKLRAELDRVRRVYQRLVAE